MSHDRVAGLRSDEWLWVLCWSGVIAIIMSLPYLYGASLSTPANQFGGFMIGVEDGNSYLAKMQEGRAGYWLFYLAYTPEPHQGALFFLFYLILGKLTTLMGVEPLSLFQWSRPFTISFGLISFYAFVGRFTADLLARRLAFWLFSITAGLGWLWVLLGFPVELDRMPVDLWVPDASFFLSALTFPHLPLAQGLLLWVVIATLSFLESGYWKDGVVAAVIGFLVSLIHPYTLIILGTIFGAYLLWQIYCQKRWLWSKIGRLALIILPSLPYLIYVLAVFELNFAFKSWREQSLTWSPHLIHYILGFGLLLPLVAVGLWRNYFFSEKPEISFLVIWVLLVPFLLYIPTPLQRRFLDGYQAALAVLGAIGLAWLIRQIKIPGLRLLAVTTIFGIMVLTNLFLLLGAVLTVARQEPPVFHSGSEQAAFQWLADQRPGQVVIAAYETSNVLPAYAPVRVFVGHGPETVRSLEKQAILPQFFAEENDEIRRRLIQDYGIAYLFYGPKEQALGTFAPAHSHYFQRVYDNGTVQIYKVVGLNK